MKLKQATFIAGQVREQLAPYCSRIEIAGSIRRQKPDPRDIEIVCIPNQITVGLFGETVVEPRFVRAVSKWDGVKGSPLGKYTQRNLRNNIKLDLFMASPDNWGLIFLIRTGSADFSHQMMTRLLLRGLRSEDGSVWDGDERIRTPEEKNVFALLDIPYMEPWERSL